MSFFYKIKSYETNKAFGIMTSSDMVLIKFDSRYVMVHRPTEEVQKGRIVEFIDEDTVIYDNEYSETKAEWIEAEMNLGKGLLND